MKRRREGKASGNDWRMERERRKDRRDGESKENTKDLGYTLHGGSDIATVIANENENA